MKKLLSTTLAVGIFASLSFSPMANAEPGLVNVNESHMTGTLTGKANVNVETNGNNMTVTSTAGNGGVSVTKWNTFNIKDGQSVNNIFTGKNQTFIYRVNGGKSTINGKFYGTTRDDCVACGYHRTGKVIFLNPDGVLFGEHANVNLNSFTVSTHEGTFDENANKLTLTRNGQSPNGIKIMEGAVIKGVDESTGNVFGKAVNIVSDNVEIYKGSLIATSVAPNANNYSESFGAVKIVTSDGVNFTYNTVGAVKRMDTPKFSQDRMVLTVNGDIDAGSIDIRNVSQDAGSELNLAGATLKATKAVNGNDGSILLVADRKIAMDGSDLKTVNYEADAAPVAGGNITITAGNGASVGNSKFDAVGDIKITSSNADVSVAGTSANAAKTIEIAANNGGVALDDATLAAKKITITAKNDVTGSADVTNNQTNIFAGKDINVNLKNVGNRDNGLVAEAGKNLTVTTDGTLSVSRLIAKEGDLTINADKVIKGLPYTTEQKLDDDLVSDRSYIEVRNGKFTSNTTNDSYERTATGEYVDNGNATMRHHIEYGEGSEKILLVTKMPVVRPPQPEPEPQPQPDVNPTPAPSVDDDQAAMLNRIPRQPESLNNNTNIANNRTALVDVFAAAAQVEIEDDEEE
ncbi:filamentous hemagglutinin N-terminal domain-containing protein [bacterium]|nr:filamentous hemagglutinin N-terminal domain-containing protein [bacterium]